MRAAVVGHVEWVEFIRVEQMPSAGDIVHAQQWWEEPGGGGPGAAVQLAKLADDCIFYTALGDDELGHRAYDELSKLGLRVEAVFRPEPTRRAVTHIDGSGERTITVLGERLAPLGSDDLAWDELSRIDGVYFTAGDVAALRNAREARILVATSRIVPLLAQAGVQLDALVGSADDPSEAYQEGEIDPPPRLVVRTRGGDGGTVKRPGEPEQAYPSVMPPGPIVDRYGAGDTFAGGLTFGLGAGHPPRDAVMIAARCGAASLTGRGPYEGQLTRDDLHA